MCIRDSPHATFVMLYNLIGFIVISLRCATYMACCHWLQLEMTYYFAIARVFGRFMSYVVNQYVYKVCMFKLSQRSKFFHGRRRKKLLSKFRTKSSVNTSIGSRFHPTVVAALKSRPLRKTNLCQAFLQQEVSHRFMVTHKTYCLFNCWLYGIGIRFCPNNLKRKARCGSRLLEYVQVKKIMQKLRKRKVRKHVKVLPRKVFQNRQACH